MKKGYSSHLSHSPDAHLNQCTPEDSTIQVGKQSDAMSAGTTHGMKYKHPNAPHIATGMSKGSHGKNVQMKSKKRTGLYRS